MDTNCGDTCTHSLGSLAHLHSTMTAQLITCRLDSQGLQQYSQLADEEIQRLRPSKSPAQDHTACEKSGPT